MLKEGTYNRWTCRFNSSPFIAPYSSVAKIGRVFVYLLDGDTPVSYWKGDAADFENENPKIQWVELINDPSIGAISEPRKAGIVAFKLSIKKRTQANPFDFIS
jgi:hypothetical protein